MITGLLISARLKSISKGVGQRVACEVCIGSPEKKPRRANAPGERRGTRGISVVYATGARLGRAQLA